MGEHQRTRLRYEDWPEMAWRFRAYRWDGPYYATNRDGDGLFIVNPAMDDTAQLLGTGQFHAADLPTFRRKLQAWRRQHD